MTGGQKIALGAIASGVILLVVSRSSSAKTVQGGNGTPTDKNPTTGRLRPPASAPAPVLQVASDLSTYAADGPTLQRVTARLLMELDALGAPPRDDTVQRAVSWLRARGISVPGTLDLTTPGPLTIWAARKVDEAVRARFYGA